MSQSQSQYSDFVPSLYDGNTETLGYLTPLQNTTTSSGSQNQYLIDTFEPCSEPDFLRLVDPPLIPDSLLRVGPNRRKEYLLYDNMAHDDWVQWWIETDFGRKSKVVWDLNRSSDLWQEYNQVASIKDGMPKVMCKRCGTILEHPMNSLPTKGYQGTSTIKKHLGTANCIRAGQGKGGLGISQFLKTKV
jgi:hypothetical protein